MSNTFEEYFGKKPATPSEQPAKEQKNPDNPSDRWSDFLSRLMIPDGKIEKERAIFKPYEDIMKEYIHKPNKSWNFFDNNSNIGYKLHLNVTPQSVLAISEFLKQNDYDHKYLSGGEPQDGKVFTVYTGSKQQTEQIVKEVSDAIGQLLEPPLAGGEIAYAPNIVGRFAVQGHGFHQYGIRGISLLSDMLDLKKTNPDEAFAKSEAVLREKFGDYYGGGIEYYDPSTKESSEELG